MDFRIPRPDADHDEYFNGEAREYHISYLVCASGCGDLVAVGSHFKGNDTFGHIFASELIPQLEKHEVVIVPQALDEVGYYWEGHTVALSEIHNTAYLVAIINDINNHFKKWGCLNEPSSYRSDEDITVYDMHEMLAKVVALLTQLERKG